MLTPRRSNFDFVGALVLAAGSRLAALGRPAFEVIKVSGIAGMGGTVIGEPRGVLRPGDGLRRVRSVKEVRDGDVRFWECPIVATDNRLISDPFDNLLCIRFVCISPGRGVGDGWRRSAAAAAADDKPTSGADLLNAVVAAVEAAEF
jgi:hypothetical protein